MIETATITLNFEEGCELLVASFVMPYIFGTVVEIAKDHITVEYSNSYYLGRDAQRDCRTIEEEVRKHLWKRQEEEKWTD